MRESHPGAAYMRGAALEYQRDTANHTTKHRAGKQGVKVKSMYNLNYGRNYTRNCTCSNGGCTVCFIQWERRGFDYCIVLVVVASPRTTNERITNRLQLASRGSERCSKKLALIQSTLSAAVPTALLSVGFPVSISLASQNEENKHTKEVNELPSFSCFPAARLSYCVPGSL